MTGVMAQRIVGIVLLALALSVAPAGVAVSISEGTYEDRPQFIVRTGTATWWYDKAGGGFSRLLDRDGRDWIGFSRHPLNKFPDSAAAGYRGIPNAVFGRDNPDAGAGHPGFNQCESTLVSSNAIRSVTTSKRWAWTWTFNETHARLNVEKVDPAGRYWFLYEGPPGGRWSPASHYWGTDQGGPRPEKPDIKNQLFGRWRWVYFGDEASPRTLFAAQAEPDALDDTIWYMGAGDGGAITAADGMMVFGFGRAAGAKPLLQEPRTFFVGFHEGAVTGEAGHQAVAAWIEKLLPARE
jgi:hypothetical protein